MNNFIFFWLIVALCFLLFELGSPGLFYFLSFSCGALVAAIAGAFCITIFDQAMVFLLSSIAAFLILKTWVKRHGRQRHFHSNVYALQGKKGVVITPATADQFGYAHIGGEIWAYKAMHNEDIPAGSPIQVVEIRGAHVVARPLES